MVDIVITPDGATPTLFVAPADRAVALAAKRAIDVVVAAGLLLVLSPLLVLVAVAVRLSGPGPVLFRQLRVGRDGEAFVVVKFRTMAPDTTARLDADPELRRAYEDNGFKLPAGTEHTTTLGRLLRATSIDELPQLWLVLRGSMSLVGVRPMEAAQLQRRSFEDQQAYIAMRPGLTGLWQVSGRSTTTWDERCRLETQYVQNWSVAHDLSIMARTPLAVLRFGETS
jgi:lipopolysaccharide/colanic/teichoic acid biosynthesis glycosyltransferase